MKYSTPGNSSMRQRIADALCQLQKTLARRDAHVRTVESDFSGQKLALADYQKRTERLAAVNQHFERSWLAALDTLDQLCQRVRHRQPHLNVIDEQHINQGESCPDALAFGRLHCRYENWRGYVPRLVPFPLPNALWRAPGDETTRQIHQLLLRLLHVVPVGQLEITAFDPSGLGRALEPFRPLLAIKKLVPAQRILTRSDEIEHALAALTDEVENLIQNRFTEQAADWAAYRSTRRDRLLPYRLLLIFDLPEQLSDRSLWSLTRLIEHGPRCGVLPVMVADVARLEDRKFNALRDALRTCARPIDALVKGDIVPQTDAIITVSEEGEFWPQPLALDNFLRQLAQCYQQHAGTQRPLGELWAEEDYWRGSSAQGISAPIGWSDEGEPVCLALGGTHTEHHVLLAGRSGSGKSNLLHVLIHGLCHAYGPDELRVWLLDYKQGTEFSAYASPPLPHASLVATEGCPEYGVTVLTHLCEELDNRARQFKQHNVRDIGEYRAVCSEPLPRLLLIVDEFQILFSSGRDVADKADRLLNQLLRQGRAYGIHLLLATQTLRGLQSGSTGQLISQMGCRLALACSQEDSAMILGNGNWAAAELNSPPQGIINNANGALNANQRLTIPQAQRQLLQHHLASMAARAQAEGYCTRTRVFNGSHLPAMPHPAWFAERSDQQLRLLPGLCLDFSEAPLAIPCGPRAANMLIAGYDRRIQKGLLLSMLRSVATSGQIDEIVWFNPNGVATDALFSAGDVPVRHYQHSDELAGLLSAPVSARRVLLIEGLDEVKAFHSDMSLRGAPKKDEPPSPKDLLRVWLENGPRHGSFTFAFTDNWRRCNTLCKELTPLFEQRIGFAMNEDDAGAFLSGGSLVKFKGLTADNRAAWADRTTSEVTTFRPFISEDDK